MKVCFVKPNALLSAYIERYWCWESDGDGSNYLPHVPPGVGIDLYFHYKKPFEVNNFGVLSNSHLIYSIDKSYNILPATQVGFIVARFRCGMFGSFTSIPIHQLANTFVDANTIWNEQGKHLEEKIVEAKSTNERINILEIFLLQQLTLYHKPVSGWKGIMDTLFYHYEEVKLDQLTRQMKITPRHFRRVFYEVSGMSPKRFQQLSRFRAVLKKLLINRNSDYLSIALENGYFDQTHFIKEFKKFMNVTPSVFLTSNNFESHFYYKSLK